MMRLFVILVFALLWSCGPDTSEADRQARIDREIQARLDAFKERRIEQCWEKATRAAKDSVDAYFIALDQSGNRIKSPYAVPTKPIRPDWKPSVDTTPIRPIFDSLAGDSR